MVFAKQSFIDREFFGMNLGLERILAFLEASGHPEKKLPVIHVVGTNGKGSTAAMLAAILKKSGYRVGLYTSPHLRGVRERFQIKGVQISARDFEVYSQKVKDVEVTLHDKLSYFEFMTALAFLYFHEKGVEIAVMEAGMGGPLDATNVCEPILTLVTSIGIDHTQYLGKSEEAIAAEKAKVFRKNVPVVTTLQTTEVFKTLKKSASQSETTLSVVEAPFLGELSLRGDFQRYNAALAIEAAHHLKALGWKIAQEDIKKACASTSWPGRLEVLQEHPLLIADGAHNPHAMKALQESLEKLYPRQKFSLLFAAMRDKDIDGMIREIGPLTEEVFCWSVASERAMSADELVRHFKNAGYLAKALTRPQELLPWKGPGPLLITGSLYGVGEAYQLT